MPARRLLVCLLACASPLAAHAQPVSGPYVSLGGGVDFLQNEAVRPDGFGPAPRSYAFDPGGAVTAAVGYGLGNGFRIEAEGDYADNHAHGVLIPAQFEGFRAGGYQQQYGGFGNVFYDVKLGLPIQPYVGIGAGYQEVELDHINSTPYQAITRGSPVETRGNFAYQGVAGFSLPLPIHGLSLTLEYRLIGVLPPGAYYRGSVNEDIPVFTPAPVQAGTGAFHFFPAPSTPTFRTVQIAEHATFDNIFNHEILFGLRYAFNAAPPPPPPAAAAAMAPAASVTTSVCRSAAPTACARN